MNEWDLLFKTNLYVYNKYSLTNVSIYIYKYRK